MNSLHTEISGWGRYPVGSTDLVRAERIQDVAALAASSATLIPRGLGRSYGDAAFSSVGRTVEMGRLNRMLAFDPNTGMLTCEAGVTIQELLTHFVPRGFFPPVTPGTQFVTLGGALACDVHGKNHHKDGSISRHVLEFEMVTGAGDRIVCSRDRSPDVFWATLGGMGLTGIITQVTLRLKRVGTSFVNVDYDRAGNLEEAFHLFEEGDDRYVYSVAWIDCLSSGPSLGRCVLMRGNPAALDDLPGAKRHDPLPIARPGTLGIPFDLPGVVLNHATMRAFNGLYYRRYPEHGRNVLTHYQPFFYPLDGIRNWNRMYGRQGFVQYQFLLPDGAERDALPRILSEITRSGSASFLAVLKRFGPTESEQMLSFPRRGYTLALDFAARNASVMPLLTRLDAMVAEHHGRVYLAKDSRMAPELLRRMYPELPRWLAVKEQVDPENRFASDLSARLNLAA